MEGDFILNVQADEPLLEPEMLDRLASAAQTSECDVFTPVFPLTSTAELTDSNLVKVARAVDGRALYFSRSPVPCRRDVPLPQWLQHEQYWGHVGVYGYRRDVLAACPSLPRGRLEASEKLEQLRLLEAGYQIGAVEWHGRPIGVDAPGDLEAVRAVFAAHSQPSCNAGAPTVSSPGAPVVRRLPWRESKAWGIAEHLAGDPDYQLDRITVRQGCCCSLHFHRYKVNSFVVLRGSLLVEWTAGGEPRQRVLSPGDGACEIAAGVNHRFCGLSEDTVALELYVPTGAEEVTLDDIVRLQPGGVFDAGAPPPPATVKES